LWLVHEDSPVIDQGNNRGTSIFIGINDGGVKYQIYYPVVLVVPRRWWYQLPDTNAQKGLPMARKPTDYVQFKLRIRQSLLKQIQKQAEKKKHSANNEAVERLERSFADEAKEVRDSAILDMMIGGKVDLKGMITRTLASQLARDTPNQSLVKHAQELLKTIEQNEKTEAEQKGDGGKVDLKELAMRTLASQRAKGNPNQSLVRQAQELLKDLEDEEREEAEQKAEQKGDE
jgi:hypothetical protein